MNLSGTDTKAAPLAAQLSGLSVQFSGRETPLFHDFSIEINHGENVLLLGPTGSGKSTLLKILAGLIPEVIDVPMRSKSKKVFEECGFVFQDPDSQFCMPFIDEEIAFVLENTGTPRARMPGKIQHYLESVGLYFEENHRPIETLSQGQKQRLALASALALEPRTLILDEPTALLDSEGTTAIWENIHRTAHDKTIVIVEHKIEEVLDFTDRVIVLNKKGQIIADGTADEIQHSNESLLDQYGIWHSNSWPNYDRNSFTETSGQKSTAIKNLAPLFEISRLEGFYGDNKQIELRNLTIYPGEWITITGPNGAGKSTLLLALMQLIKTDQEVKFQGENIHKTEELSSEVGFVFQNPELQFIRQTVEEEIAFTLEQQDFDWDEVQGRVKNTINRFGLEKVRSHNPYQLSTGQQRRLSVAATTVKERKILLLDEPTFGQDARNTFAILEHLEKLRREGTAILMVTHDPEIVKRFATRRWQIESGKLKSDISEAGLGCSQAKL